MDLSTLVQSHLHSSAQTKLDVFRQCGPQIEQLGIEIARCLATGGKVLTCGNGGSASDSEHIAAEFVGRFRRERRSLPAISLTGPGSLITAIGNDYGYENVFSRQVEGQGNPGDVLVCLSTTGNSPSVINAAKAAKAKQIFTAALTGRGGGKLGEEVDLEIRIPSTLTAHIQECHITVAHIVCEIVDELCQKAAVLNFSSKPSKIRSLTELTEMRRLWRGNQIVVWTNGCFDLLHPGHVRNLQEAKLLGNVLVVGVNSDRSVRELKGPARPIFDENSRAELLASLTCVDFVTIFDDLTPIPVLEAIRPDIHCKGGEYADGQKPIPEREIVERHGGRLHFLKLHEGFSTTGLVQKIRSR